MPSKLGAGDVKRVRRKPEGTVPQEICHEVSKVKGSNLAIIYRSALVVRKPSPDRQVYKNQMPVVIPSPGVFRCHIHSILEQDLHGPELPESRKLARQPRSTTQIEYHRRRMVSKPPGRALEQRVENRSLRGGHVPVYILVACVDLIADVLGREQVCQHGCYVDSGCKGRSQEAK